MIELNKINEFVPIGSYSYVAVETYESDQFKFRTGPNISVLEIKNTDGMYDIKLRGKLEVYSDDECWAILLHFRSEVLSDIMHLIKNDAYNTGFKKGKQHIQRSLKDIIFGSLDDHDYDEIS